MPNLKTLKDKTVLIIGGTGSLGQALTRRLCADNQVILFSRDELKQWTLRNEIKDPNVGFVVGDMRDGERLEETLIRHNPHVILIAAALKQVDTCELAPAESIKTNILGVQNLVDAVERNMHRLDQLETVVMISTDKACAPTNVYGMSKAIAERIVVSCCRNHKTPKFVAVRYGNVLDSRGSIIPLFRHQADHSRAFTLTHPEMTRFLMTLDDSIDLILTSIERGASGTTWLPELKAMRIKDLAQLFSEKYDKPVEVIGIRPGEKMHETLISDAESVRSTKVDGFYILQPSFEPIPQDAEIFDYSSDQDVLSPKDLKKYLNSLGLLDADVESFGKGPHVDVIRKD